MSDERLRELEREILADPGALDLRRRHAQELLRAGDEDRGLAALDLAWRLGADDLWDDLQARLGARAIKLATMELRYVPGGPFAMGADDLDADARPLHIVHLSPFYVSARPLMHRDIQTWPAHWISRARGALDYWLSRAATLHYAEAVNACAWIDGTQPLQRPGEWRLITEAQWERVFRASHFRRDGVNPYGVTSAKDMPEWTLDDYTPDAYEGGPRRDPVVRGVGELRVVRGVPVLPAPHFALYREAVKLDGTFSLSGRVLSTELARHEEGIATRPVFVPAAGP